MRKGKQAHPIPDSVFLPAVNATLIEFSGVCADKWGEMEKARCRQLCGPSYQFVETDWVGRRAITLRKAGKCVSVNGGPKRKRKQQPSGEYRRYLEGGHWRSFRSRVLAFWNNRCCLCKSSAVDVHHNTYQNIGDELLTDCVALCRKCHDHVHSKMPCGNDQVVQKVSKS